MKLSLVCIFVFEKKFLLEKDHSKVNVIIYLIKQLLFQDAQVATIFFLGFFLGRPTYTLYRLYGKVNDK